MHTKRNCRVSSFERILDIYIASLMRVTLTGRLDQTYCTWKQTINGDREYVLCPKTLNGDISELNRDRKKEKG